MRLTGILASAWQGKFQNRSGNSRKQPRRNENPQRLGNDQQVNDFRMILASMLRKP